MIRTAAAVAPARRCRARRRGRDRRGPVGAFERRACRRHGRRESPSTCSARAATSRFGKAVRDVHRSRARAVRLRQRPGAGAGARAGAGACSPTSPRRARRPRPLAGRRSARRARLGRHARADRRRRSGGSGRRRVHRRRAARPGNPTPSSTSSSPCGRSRAPASGTGRARAAARAARGTAARAPARRGRAIDPRGVVHVLDAAGRLPRACSRRCRSRRWRSGAAASTRVRRLPRSAAAARPQRLRRSSCDRRARRRCWRWRRCSRRSGRRPRAAQRTDAQAFVVIDTSRSMAARPSPTGASRLQRAKQLALAIGPQLGDVPVGVATFTDRVLPDLFPTSDRATYDSTVSALGIEDPPPEEISTVATTFDALQQVATSGFFPDSVRKRAVILITDGESRPFDPAAVARDPRRPRRPARARPCRQRRRPSAAPERDARGELPTRSDAGADELQPAGRGDSGAHRGRRRRNRSPPLSAPARATSSACARTCTHSRRSLRCWHSSRSRSCSAAAFCQGCCVA